MLPCLCVARAGWEGGVCMLVELAGHDGLHSYAAPGPAHKCRRCSGVEGRHWLPRCSLVSAGSGQCLRRQARFAGVGAGGGGRPLVLPLPP